MLKGFYKKFLAFFLFVFLIFNIHLSAFGGQGPQKPQNFEVYPARSIIRFRTNLNTFFEFLWNEMAMDDTIPNSRIPPNFRQGRSGGDTLPANLGAPPIVRWGLLAGLLAMAFVRHRDFFRRHTRNTERARAEGRNRREIIRTSRLIDFLSATSVTLYLAINVFTAPDATPASAVLNALPPLLGMYLPAHRVLGPANPAVDAAANNVEVFVQNEVNERVIQPANEFVNADPFLRWAWERSIYAHILFILTILAIISSLLTAPPRTTLLAVIFVTLITTGSGYLRPGFMERRLRPRLPPRRANNQPNLPPPPPPNFQDQVEANRLQDPPPPPPPNIKDIQDDAQQNRGQDPPVPRRRANYTTLGRLIKNFRRRYRRNPQNNQPPNL